MNTYVSTYDGLDQ